MGHSSHGLTGAGFQLCHCYKSLGLGQTLEFLLFVLHAVCINVGTGSLCSSLPATQSVCSVCWCLWDGQRGALSARPARIKCRAKCCAMPSVPCHPCLPAHVVPHLRCCAMLLITVFEAAHTPWKHLNLPLLFPTPLSPCLVDCCGFSGCLHEKA